MTPDEKGFTLVEIAVVLLIIGILSSVLVPVISNRITEAKYTQALADISKMEVALAAYELDFQDYPPTGTDTTTGIYMYLCKGNDQGLSMAPKKWKGPYLEVKLDRITNRGTDTYADDQILDPWGNPYSYVHNRDYELMGTWRGVGKDPGDLVDKYYNMKGFQVFSAGKNGSSKAYPFAGTESDDVNNWYGDERQR